MHNERLGVGGLISEASIWPKVIVFVKENV